MSASKTTHADSQGHWHEHGHAASEQHGDVHRLDHGRTHGHGPHDDGAGHSTFKGYMTGFVLAVLLTAVPFWLVMDKVFANSGTTALVILAIGAVQIVVHMVYFLHMNSTSEGGWTLLALIFTLVLVVITLSGSLWVMYHLNHNMMPAAPHEMRNMP